MIKYIKLLVVPLLIVLFSCSEENNDESVNYPIIYKNISATKNSIKVFTKNGEITDINTVNNLISRYGNFLAQTNNYNFKDSIAITYLNPESVEINSLKYNIRDTLTVYDNPELTYWEEKDTVCEPVAYNIGNTYYNNTFFEYKPLHCKEFEVPPSLGFYMGVKFKPCCYVKKDGDDFILPMLDFFYKGDVFCYWDSEVNNVFKKESTQYFDVSDTLIINEYSLRIEK